MSMPAGLSALSPLTIALTAALVVLLTAGTAFAQVSNPQPTKPISSFSSAKKAARDKVYAPAGERITVYCDCSYSPNARGSGGVVDKASCGYVIRKSTTRGNRIEWEHMVPASAFGQHRACWQNGDPQICVNSKGKAFKGRKCCAKIDAEFEHMEADLHNLAPSVGELNADRSNHPYGLVHQEQRLYGACDFEIGGDPKQAEPKEDRRGDVARAWLYMIATYPGTVAINATNRAMLEDWHRADPPSDEERARNDRVEAVQGNRNPFIDDPSLP